MRLSPTLLQTCGKRDIKDNGIESKICVVTANSKTSDAEPTDCFLLHLILYTLFGDDSEKKFKLIKKKTVKSEYLQPSSEWNFAQMFWAPGVHLKV